MPMASIDDSISIVRENGLRYAEADGRALLLDAAYPEGEPERPRPAVIHVHGNGWAYGTREDPWFTPYLATHGFFAASIDHRLSGDSKFPAQIHDVKAAIRWVSANADRYGVDPDRNTRTVGRRSPRRTHGQPARAGGRHRPGRVLQPRPGRAMGSGPSDFLRQGGQMEEYVTWLFGGTLAGKRDLMRLGSPLHHVAPNSPPFLIAHATLDEMVPFEQAEWLHVALSDAGAEAQLVPLPGRYHNWTGGSRSPAAATGVCGSWA